MVEHHPCAVLKEGGRVGDAEGERDCSRRQNHHAQLDHASPGSARGAGEALAQVGRLRRRRRGPVNIQFGPSVDRPADHISRADRAHRTRPVALAQRYVRPGEEKPLPLGTNGSCRGRDHHYPRTADVFVTRPRRRLPEHDTANRQAVDSSGGDSGQPPLRR
jgi:hypothetical protein